MTSENIIGTVDGSSSKQETASTIEAKANGGTFKDTAQTNSDEHPSQDAQLQPEQSQADGTLLIPADTTKPTENSTLVEQASASTEVDSKQSSTEDTADEPSTGDKRGYNPMITSTNGDKSVAESTTEPTSKKQKITDENGTNGRVTDESTPAVVHNGASNGRNGEKKTKRSRKVKEAVKKAIPTDGIGSRTRSRTKTIM